MPAYTVSRFKLETSLRTLIEKLACPFATMAMDKGVLPESHPQFAGMYSGAMSSFEVLKAVEGADLVIDAGGVCFHDNNTGAYSSQISPDKFLTIGLDYVRVGERVFNPVRMGDVFDGVAKAVRKNFGYKATLKSVYPKPSGKSGDPITVDAMYDRYRDFLKPRDQIVIENGSSTAGIVPLPLPDGAQVHGQSLWGSIGWATAAALGVAMADRSRRTRAFYRRGLAPIVRCRYWHHGPQWA